MLNAAKVVTSVAMIVVIHVANVSKVVVENAVKL